MLVIRPVYYWHTINCPKPGAAFIILLWVNVFFGRSHIAVIFPNNEIAAIRITFYNYRMLLFLYIGAYSHMQAVVKLISSIAPLSRTVQHNNCEEKSV